MEFLPIFRHSYNSIRFYNYDPQCIYYIRVPVDRWFLQLFVGFQASKVMQDFFYPQYVIICHLRGQKLMGPSCVTSSASLQLRYPDSHLTPGLMKSAPGRCVWGGLASSRIFGSIFWSIGILQCQKAQQNLVLVGGEGLP